MRLSLRKLCRIGSSAATTAGIVLAIYGLIIYWDRIIAALQSGAHALPISVTYGVWWSVVAIVTTGIVVVLWYLLQEECNDLNAAGFFILIFVYFGIVICIGCAIPITEMTLGTYWTALIPSWVLILFLIFYESRLFKFCNRFRG